MAAKRDTRWRPGVPVAATAANLSHRVFILENSAFCDACGKFGSSKTAVVAEPCRGRNVPKATRTRRDAMAQGYHPYQKVKIGWPRRYTGAAAPTPAPAWEEDGLEEPERGMELDIDVKLIMNEGGEAEPAVQAETAKVKTTKQWLKRTLRDPRKGRRT